MITLHRDVSLGTKGFGPGHLSKISQAQISHTTPHRPAAIRQLRQGLDGAEESQAS